MADIPLKLLTVDDESGMRRSIRAYFEDNGFQVLEAADGLQSVKAFHTHRPDVMLIDLKMPNMGGLEVLDILGREAEEVPMVVVSGAGELNTAIEAIRKGAWDYVTKPISDMDVLGHVIEKVLERARLIRENRCYRLHLEEEVAHRTEQLQRANLEERVLNSLGLLALEQTEITPFLKKLLTQLFKSIVWLHPSSHGAVFLFHDNENREAMFLVAGQGIEGADINGLVTPWEQCQASDGQDVQFFPASSLKALALCRVTAGLYCVPLLQNSKLLGVMVLCVLPHHKPNAQRKQFLRHVADVLSLGLLRRYAEQEAVHLAYFNALTGLPNRRLMQDRLQQELERSRRQGNFGALLAVDLDRFQTINDALGHDKGDLLLVQVAEKLALCGRKADTVAHLGGDDFVMLLTDLGQDSVIASYRARVVTDKINASLSHTYNLQGNEYQPTISVGIAVYPMDGSSAEELLRHVDTAKYSAKQAGRNTMRFYRPDMQCRADYRFNLSKNLQHAVRQEQFELRYQPQVDNTGRLLGAEALLRWRHPKQGLISPEQFIPIAEETGLIGPVGDWALLRACFHLQEWDQRGLLHGFRHLAVNISPYQFRQPDFTERLIHVLRETGCNPKLLALEITESMLVEEVEEVSRRMELLRKLGVTFSVDDFGTGYSSLAYLKQLPIDQLKIDQSFVRDINCDPNDAAIVDTIIGMAMGLSLNLVAEGVENKEQMHYLHAHGCRVFQGFYFSRPIPLEEFETVLRSGAVNMRNWRVEQYEKDEKSKKELAQGVPGKTAP